MKFYIEPIGEKSNGIIAGFLSVRGDSIEVPCSTLFDKNGIKHSVYGTEDHALITFLKKSSIIKINEDFRIYVKEGEFLTLSFIDHKK